MKNKKIALIISLSLSLSALVFTTACSSSANYNTPQAYPSTAASSSASYGLEMSREIGYGEDVMEDAAYDTGEMYESAADSGVGFTDVKSVSATTNANRMIITTVDLNIETQEFDKSTEDVQVMAEDFGGFVQDSYIQGRSMFEKYGTRTASFTLRIPAERLDAFIGGIGDQYNVTRKQQSGQDITESYHDNEARLNSLRIQEKRLLEMMEGASELKYLIEVQKELADVQYQIDSYTSSKLRMQNQVSMSTVYLTIQEVVEYTPVEPEPITFGGRFLSTVGASWNTFVSFVQGCVLALIWLLPYLLMIAVVLVVIILLVKRFGGKVKRPVKKGWKEIQLPASADSADQRKDTDNE